MLKTPQVEDGFTRIANELLEALPGQPLSGQEFRVILFIIRKTYGYHKKYDRIALSQFQKALKISKVRCYQVIKSLISKNIITVYENIDGCTRKLGINKSYLNWKGVYKNIDGKKGIEKHIPTVKVLRNKGSMKTYTTKETITKEKIKKGNSRFIKPSISEISEYCHTRKNNINPEAFFDFYESKGWKIGKNPMKDWKAAIRTWELKNKTEEAKYL